MGAQTEQILKQDCQGGRGPRLPNALDQLNSQLNNEELVTMKPRTDKMLMNKPGMQPVRQALHRPYEAGQN